MRRSASAAASEAGGRTGEVAGGATGETATAGGGDAGGVACSGEVEVLMTLEPAHFRGHRVPFALNRRDGAIGVRRRFRGKRQDRRRCGRRTGETATAGGGDARGVAGSGEVKSR